MNAPGYELEDNGSGNFTVRIGRAVAGYVSEDAEHPGLWIVEDQDGQFMGRHRSQDAGAEFLAAWFIAEEQDWS
ncbi:DUF2158 domain-containing protein [Methylorubrum aminovorans]